MLVDFFLPSLSLPSKTGGPQSQLVCAGCRTLLAYPQVRAIGRGKGIERKRSMRGERWLPKNAPEKKTTDDDERRHCSLLLRKQPPFEERFSTKLFDFFSSSFEIFFPFFALFRKKKKKPFPRAHTFPDKISLSLSLSLPPITTNWGNRVPKTSAAPAAATSPAPGPAAPAAAATTAAAAAARLLPRE